LFDDPRWSSRIVKCIDTFYLEPVPEKEFKEIYAQNGVFEVIKDRKFDKPSLEDYISEQSNISYNMGEVPYKFTIIENY